MMAMQSLRALSGLAHPHPSPFSSLLVLLFKDRVSLCSPRWPGIHVPLASLPSHALDLSEDKLSPLPPQLHSHSQILFRA